MALRSARALLFVTLATGCHRPKVNATAPVQPAWSHCWWTAIRTSLPPDTVAVRFQHGFALAGLTGGTRTRNADTAWTRAGPTPLDGPPAAASYASRAVALRQGDSTTFRYYVGVVPPRGGWSQPSDTLMLSRRRLELCGAIAQGAAVPWTLPRRDPNREDSLNVWSRVP